MAVVAGLVAALHAPILAVWSTVFLAVVRVIEDYVVYPRLMGTASTCTRWPSSSRASPASSWGASPESSWRFPSSRPCRLARRTGSGGWTRSRSPSGVTECGSLGRHAVATLGGGRAGHQPARRRRRVSAILGRLWAAGSPTSGGGSTRYYGDNERRLFAEHFPALEGLRILKTICGTKQEHPDPGLGSSRALAPTASTSPSPR